MRHASLIALSALVCLSFALAAAPARADVPTIQSWFPVRAQPYGVMAHSDGSVWVGTSGSVLRYSRSGTLLGTVGSYASASLAEAPGGDVYVLYCSEIYGGVIRKFSPALAPLGTIVNPATYGTGLGSDAVGNLMQPDYYQRTVHYLDAAGNTLGQFVTTGAGYFSLWTPGAADESSDHVYFVADAYNWQIVLFNGAVVATESASWGGLKASFR